MIEIPHHDVDELAGCWDHRPGAVVISCPRCGTDATLDHGEINDDGTTEHSHACPNPECRFEDILILEDYAKPVRA